MLYLNSTNKVNSKKLIWGEGMNDKFFDLKKEKQDRMINAALKVFALNGYQHASTDDIVKEAGISKGLLFHYFISKAGLYGFIYDYSVRYMLLELSTGVNKKETDYFELTRQIWQAKLQVMHSYPYMQLFLNESRKENVSEALIATEEKREVLPRQIEQIMEGSDLTRFGQAVDVEKLTIMIAFTLNGLMAEQLYSGAFQPELFGKEMRTYLTMAETLSYKEKQEETT